MACITYKGENDKQLQFIVDADSDISKLPTSTTKGQNGEGCVAIGSMAMSIGSGKIFVLASNNTWTVVGG